MSNDNNNLFDKGNEPIDVEAIEIKEYDETITEQEQTKTLDLNETAAQQEQAATLEREEHNGKERQKKQKAYTPLVVGFLGAVIGSSAMLGGFLYFDNNQQDTSTNGIQQTASDSNTPITVTNVSADDITGVVQKAQESVVGVINYQTASNHDMGSLFRNGQGANEEQATSEPQQAGSGSGIIYKKSGNKAYVVTNHHVVDGASKLEVTLSDGTTLAAKLVGSDQWTDLAVLEVDGSKITNVATLGDSDNLLAGQSVIAIGNPLGYLEGTVTQGIVSSKERSIDVDINSDGIADWQATVIQTDAAINPGNSGGALLNASGEVIGINSSKIADASVEGIGFAIPMNTAQPILEQLEKSGEVTRPQMGAQLVDLSQVPLANRTTTLKLPNNVTNGVVIAEVTEGSPAASAGLKAYDVITKIDGTTVESTVDVRKYLYNEKAVGDKIQVTYYRDGKEQTATLTLTATQNN